MKDKILIHEIPEPSGLGAFDNQDEIDFPRKIDLSKIDNIEFDDVEMDDYPDFANAYILSADMDGIPMTDEELENLNENYSGFVYEKLFDKLF
jgi:hypothetical protein